MTTSSKGNCYLCGRELSKTGMRSHILKAHAGEGVGQECCLLKVEGTYHKDYWLYLDIPVKNTLAVLDWFLRRIWLECCDHMSAFYAKRYQGMPDNRKLSTFPVGVKFMHHYDFGSTTETTITVVGPTWRPPQQEAVRLLARNVPPQFQCSMCGAPATHICPEERYYSENPFYCEECAEKREVDFMLPVTNSPRMGVCGYEGERDTYAFVPPEKTKGSHP